MPKKSKKSESSRGNNVVKPNKSILDFMPRALASSGNNIDDTTVSSSDLLQSDTQDSAAQAEVPESRTENDDLQ
ncbi:hypothetical protein, partial, partial [Parasitella parasitica]